ncbi:hypothetical protein ACXR2W_01905 [Leucobacter sp. HY1908]
MPFVTTVLGDIDVAGIDLFLPAETLIARPAKPLGNAAVPATAAAFARASVAPEMLGRLMLGAENACDRTLTAQDAAGMLTALTSTHEGTAVVAALAGHGASWSPGELGELARTSGAHIVGGTNGLAGFDPDQKAPSPEALEAQILADLSRAEYPAGAVGFIELPGEGPRRDAEAERVTAAARAARRAGVALVFAPASDIAAARRGLAATDAAGLARDRVVVTGMAELIGARLATGAPGAGIDQAKLAGVVDLGVVMCFDALGKLPNVTTVVSDHDTALALTALWTEGAGDRVLAGCGVRRKHRLTAFGGNGLEFLSQQFLPYLGMVGAGAELLAAVAAGNAAAVFARSSEEIAAPNAPATGEDR